MMRFTLIVILSTIHAVSGGCGGSPDETSTSNTPNPICTGEFCSEFKQYGEPLSSDVPHSCSRLGVGILSTSNHVQHRMIIRESWMSNAVQTTDGVQIKFFVARPATPTARQALVLESFFYGDMVLVDSEEEYHRTAWQILALMKYFSTLDCPFVAKVDDDVYLRIPQVLRYTQNKDGAGKPGFSSSLAWIGHMEANAKPLRSGKWKVSQKEWPSKNGNYPTFAGGPAHLMTLGLAKLLVQTSKSAECEKVTSWFPLEDVAVGIWVERLINKGHEIKRYNNRRFFVFHYCHENAVNTLLERGKPLFVDPNKTMQQMLKNEIAIESGRNINFCPPSTTQTAIRSNTDAEESWSGLEMKLTSEFEKKLQALQQNWRTKFEEFTNPVNADVLDSNETAEQVAIDEHKRCNEHTLQNPCVGDSIEVFWEDDAEWYSADIVWYNSDNGKHSIRYKDDNLIERIDLSRNKWRILKDVGNTTSKELETVPDTSASEGEVIEVYWPDDDEWYSARVEWFDPVRKMHLLKYDLDGRYEKVDLKFETYKSKSASKLLSRMTKSDNDLVKSQSATPANEVVIIVPNQDWHPHLNGTGIVQNCPIKCRFSTNIEERIIAHGQIFLGDPELYSGNPNVLPVKPDTNPGLQYFGIIREYIPVFPEHLWKKYDGRITYSSGEDTQSCYGYAAPWVRHTAKNSPSFEERSTTGRELIGFVSRQCKTDRNRFAKNWVRQPYDGRENRTKFVKELQQLDSEVIASYGVCANNKKWPVGHAKDKSYAIKQHLFCLAMENIRGADYVTEKVWDCLEAGSVPLYLGAPNVEEHLPFGRSSAIFIDDFASKEDLVQFLKEVATNKTLWESYRPWLRQEPPKKWKQFVKKVSVKSAKCNLCKYLAGINEAKQCDASNSICGSNPANTPSSTIPTTETLSTFVVSASDKLAKFMKFPDSTLIDEIIAEVCAVEGFTSEDAEVVLTTLKQQWIRTAGNLRTLEAEDIKQLKLPLVVTKYLQHVRTS